MTDQLPDFDPEDLHDDIADHLAFEVLARQYDEAPSDLYIATVEAMRLLTAHGGQPTTEDIGRRAWAKLGPERWQEALPALLESWASRICSEEAERSAQDHADRIAQTDGCLEEGDFAAAWDAAVSRDTLPAAEYEAVIDRDLLVRLLDEITRLRRQAAPTEATS